MYLNQTEANYSITFDSICYLIVQYLLEGTVYRLDGKTLATV